MSVPGAQLASPARPLETVPGPRGLPLVGNALQIHPEKFHQQLEAWAKQYGGAFTFTIGSRRFYVVSDPEVVASVLRNRPSAFLRSARLEQVARELGFQGLFSSNGDDWRRQRPMVLAGLDPAHIRTFLPAMVDVTARLRDRWRAAAERGEPIDLLADLMRYTVDVTTALAFGRNLNTLEEGEETAIQRHLNVILPALFRRILKPVDFGRWFADRELAPHVRALGEAVRGFIAETRAQLDANPQLRAKPENLLQALVAARDRPGSDVTDEDVSGNVLTMLLAGEDTTANTLAWMIWLLFNHPQAAQRAREESDRVLGAAGLVQEIEQLSALDEVEACANEAMRVKPVAPLIINQAAEDIVVGDVLVPRGRLVLCLMRPGGMDEKNFAQPQSFDPQRWRPHDGSEAQAKSLSSAKRTVMPFGAGARMCPGRYLALAEIKMVASMLLANFELQDVSTASGDDPIERLALTMSPVGLRMKLRSRVRAA